MAAESTAARSSCLYEGIVTHRRSRPFVHEFRYRVFMAFLDLSEIERVFSGRWFWSSARPALARYRRADHFGDPAAPLDRCVRDLVEERTGRRPSGRVRLLTHLRYYGYVINPISLYYCFDESDSTVEAIVAEVTNTPWGERHCYVLAGPPGAVDGQLWTAKELHVSPFMPMDMRYHWRVMSPGDRLSVQIENHDAEGCLFTAGMRLERRELSGWQLSRVLLRFPVMTLQVAAGIYWQAARLWWKGGAFHPHPRHHPPSDQTQPVMDPQ